MSSLLDRLSRARAEDRIFISYRRSDTTGFAGRLEDTLEAYFGERRVFRDVGDIVPGEDFVERIERSIETTAALVVLIGPDWLVSDESGEPRLHAAGDHVASEIKAALASDCLVVPVLVEGASMPTAEELPSGLKDLTRRNAVTIRDEHWTSDVTRLARVLSFDVAGTLAERRMRTLKLGVLSLLAVPLLFSLITYVRMEPGAWNRYFMAITGITLAAVLVILAAFSSWFEDSRRKFVWAAVILGFLGLGAALISYLDVGLEWDAIGRDASAAAADPDTALLAALEARAAILEPDTLLLESGAVALYPSAAALYSGAVQFEVDKVGYAELQSDEAQSAIAFVWPGVVSIVVLFLLGMSGFKPNDRLA